MKDLALCRGQGSQSLLEYHLLLDAWSGIFRLQIQRGCSLAPLLSPKQAVGLIPCDPQKPGRKLGSSPESVGALPDGDHRFLKHLFGKVRLANDGLREAKDAVGILLIQVSERRPAPCGNGFDQLCIGHVDLLALSRLAFPGLPRLTARLPQRSSLLRLGG